MYEDHFFFQSGSKSDRDVWYAYIHALAVVSVRGIWERGGGNFNLLDNLGKPFPDSRRYIF
jgi:hypothetical protein